MALPSALTGNEWRKQTACLLLPVLVHRAKLRQPITYGELNDVMLNHGRGAVLPVTYRYALGAIGDALLETNAEWREKIPPINVIVVNKDTRMPSHGINDYLDNYVHPKIPISSLTDEQRRAIVDEVQEKVYDYKRWGEILENYGLTPLPAPTRSPTAHRKYRHYGKNWSSEGESELHKELKEFVSNNPQIFGLPKSAKKGSVEHLFYSGDCADVLFAHGGSRIAVEVKARNANDADLNRGLYQCVKYRALVRAQQMEAGEIPDGAAVLVTERQLPADLRDKAKLFGIDVFDNLRWR